MDFFGKAFAVVLWIAVSVFFGKADAVFFGNADAVCIKAKSAALADAAATAIANRVRRKQDIHPALEAAMGIEQVLGALIIFGDQLGAVGDMELCKP